MAASNSHRALCATCNTIPPDFFIIKAKPSKSLPSKSVDTSVAESAELAAKCPLCYLIWNALSPAVVQLRDSSTSPMQNVALKWSNEEPDTLLVSIRGRERARIHRASDDVFEFTPSRFRDRYMGIVDFSDPEPVHPNILPKRYFYGPRRPVSIKRANFDQIGAWLVTCQTGHPVCHLQSCCPPAEHVRLRFIDVENNCIVSGTTAQPYVAISYVWGQDGQAFQLRTDNIHRLSKPGFFSNSDRMEQEKLLNLLNDASELVRKIGLRYLWVDSLCIIQDDPNDQRQQVYQMDRVYSQATLTIIALSASCVSDNLPGVQEYTREPFSTEEVIHGTRLFTNKDEYFWSTFQSSIYASRGWTFQEHLLSTRRLYFTKHQVFWECVEHCWSEDQVWAFYPDGKLDPIKAIMSRQEQAANLVTWFGFYECLVLAYSKRNLGDPADILSAFAGISSRMANWCNTQLTAGLPVRCLFRALFFTPVGENRTQRRRITGQNFPSWSWLGWQGTIGYDFMLRTDKCSDNFHLAGMVRSIRLVNLVANVYSPVTPYDPAGTFHGKPNDPATECETERWVYDNIRCEDVPTFSEVQILDAGDGMQQRVDWDPAAFFRLESPIALSFLCSSVPLHDFIVHFEERTAHTYAQPDDTFYLTPFSLPEGTLCGIICGLPEKEEIERYRGAGCGILLLAICFGRKNGQIAGLPMVVEERHPSKGVQESKDQVRNTNEAESKEAWCGCVVDLLLVVRDPTTNMCERLAIGKIHSNFWWKLASSSLERFYLI